MDDRTASLASQFGFVGQPQVAGDNIGVQQVGSSSGKLLITDDFDLRCDSEKSCRSEWLSHVFAYIEEDTKPPIVMARIFAAVSRTIIP